ncbi:hypothetical protein KVR01_005623 [Diaporthe batatas]|uniref:uncharacterized protein n=1 Tax=Diaporthe batatas TaxID=748121 RepID=UPI001D035F5B|nr:uncharacterized protein KVR01_005623 [Diaporthe batatas]KAG8165348.1 hypothetical protein KVR01_005623 [Diaporthe batatas]
MSELSSTNTLTGESVPTSIQGGLPVVHLQVGERLFNTHAHTLCKESAYFRSLVSGEHQQLADGTIFVDADPDLFAHVLRYLRHGIYPVCFNQTGGHHHARYMGIKQLAEHFEIENLARWLANRQYESAIECSLSLERVRLGDMSTSPSSAERIHCVGTPDDNGLVSVLKHSYTAREDVFLRQIRQDRDSPQRIALLRLLRARKDPSPCSL